MCSTLGSEYRTCGTLTCSQYKEEALRIKASWDRPRVCALLVRMTTAVQEPQEWPHQSRLQH